MRRMWVFGASVLLVAVGAADRERPRLHYDPGVFPHATQRPRLAYDPIVLAGVAAPVPPAAYPPCGPGRSDRCNQQAPRAAPPSPAPRQALEAEPIGM